MATPKQFLFTFKELAELMVQATDIKEGLWGIYVKFGLQAMNVGADDKDLRPAALLPILELGLQQFDSPGSLTVDAAEVRRKKTATARPHEKKATKTK